MSKNYTILNEKKSSLNIAMKYVKIRVINSNINFILIKIIYNIIFRGYLTFKL